jgi:type II secretion system protein G
MRESKLFKAFTLIELLIVVAIIAILAAIAVPNFLEAQTRSKVSRTKADMRTIATALESYFVDNNKYPISYNAVDTAVDPRIQRFAPLSTPISYITSVPPDIFSRDTSNIYPDKDIRVPIYVDRRTYVLWVTEALSGGDNGRNVYRDLWGTQYTQSEWLLRSRGPAGTAGGLGGTGSQFDKFDVYDPTNGTVSTGNILLLGPGIGYVDGV